MHAFFILSMGGGNSEGHQLNRVHFVHPTLLKEKLPQYKTLRLKREVIQKLTCKHCSFVAHK